MTLPGRLRHHLRLGALHRATPAWREPGSLGSGSPSAKTPGAPGRRHGPKSLPERDTGRVSFPTHRAGRVSGDAPSFGGTSPVREPLRIGSTRHPRVLEVDARAWVARQPARPGRRGGLANIPAHEIETIAELGFDLVWLTGAWTIGTGSRRLWRSSRWMCEKRAELLPHGSDDDIVGSPYAVAAYEPAENLGGEVGLAALRARLAQAGVGLILDFYPNQTSTDHPWVRRHPDWYVHADTTHREEEPEAYFEVRSDGRHWIAHGRDPNFPPLTDTAQLEYRHPEVPRAMMQTLRDIATRCDGVVCSMAMLVLDDVFRGDVGCAVRHADRDRRPVALRRVLVARVERRSPGLPELRADRRGVLGARVAPPAARLRLHLRQAAAGPAARRRRGRGRWPPAGRGRVPAPVGPVPRGSRRASDRRTDGPAPGAGRGADRRDRARACSSSTTARWRGRGSALRSSCGASRRRSPTRRSQDFYRRLLLATDDETFRLGQAIRLEPTTAWPGNQSHEGIVARLWVGQHRQLRLAVANLTAQPAQAFIPMSLPEFAGKEIRLEDQLDEDIVYDRPGDDLLVRGLYVDLPATAATSSGSPGRPGGTPPALRPPNRRCATGRP